MGALEAATRLRGDVAANLAFFTRLPIADAGAAPNFRQIAWAAPLAGAIVGAIGAAALFIGAELGLPDIVDATLGLSASIAAAGALHEDGLADVADGFGGGATREAKLAIMRDSRLGAYGAIAVGLSLILRIGALSAAMSQGVGFAVAAMLLTGAVARAGALAPLAFAAPARSDGAGASAARGITPSQFFQALAVALVLAVALGLAGLGVLRALFAVLIAAGAAQGVVTLAERQIGGQTGDVAGAAAQAAEAAALVALLIWLRAP